MYFRLKRFALAVLAALSLSGIALPASEALAAPSPWWQLLTSTRPTNLWEPTDNIQEITSKRDDSKNILVAEIEVSGEVIGCLGAGSFLGKSADFWCNSLGYAPQATETAEELEQLLEPAFGTAAVEVTGGPAATAPFIVRTAGRAAPTIHLDTFSVALNTQFGTANAKLIFGGGSGRLVITLTNLGDAPVDASSTPLTIIDKLPPGVEATGVEAVAGGYERSAGPVNCEVVAADEISCTYEGKLPSYEAIEVEVLVSLTAEPPGEVPPGEIAVSGGNAASVSAVQDISVSPAPASFGFESFSAQPEEEGGAPTTNAGRHPFQFTTTIQLNSASLPGDRSSVEPPALPRNLRFALPLGFIGNATATPTCPMATFVAQQASIHCPDSAVVGASSVTIIETVNLGGLTRIAVPVFNLPPGIGEPARFGFLVGGTPVIIDTKVDPDDQYRVTALVRNATQVAKLLATTTTLWGTPGDPRHDSARGWDCLEGTMACQRPPGLKEKAFLRVPVSCVSPLDFRAEIEPWNVPFGSDVDGASFAGGQLHACNQVPFKPNVTGSPTGRFAGSPSGFDFRLEMPNAGLLDGDAIAEGQAKKVEVTLPEGVTINPSQANGLGACTPEQYVRETSESLPGDGCPEDSKIGSVAITTPLLEEEAHGSVYVAKPYDNPFGSLLAMYMVAKIPERGILVKQAGKVELDPDTGQIVTTFDGLPQIPFEEFNLQFFDGERAPLVMPSSCGTYDVLAKFTPWSAADPGNPAPNEVVTRTSSFSIDHGLEGGSCPTGTPPFQPTFVAGTESNAAGSYSPLNVRLTRQDGEQELRTFSLNLPKGVIGNLSGILFCPEAAIAAARARTGPNGAQEELDNPSCPGGSQIGRTLVGAGVGSSLSYTPGKVYLAGPYKGAKLSIVAVTTAKVGPFDLGNVVIRQALKVDPETAEVSTEGSSSDPIPHILQGIVVHARDIRVYVDRGSFVLNPTSCDRMSAAASVLGSGLDFGSSGDDRSVEVRSPFQAADCARLGFKPKLSLSLRGDTKRGGNPRLKAVVTARKGDANIGAAAVTLPHSEFLDQAHIRTVCTRVQFSAGGGNGEQCPKGAVYGRARAISPLLDEPLAGPVFLRSSNDRLPNLVVALHSGKVNVNLVGRIDSVGNGRIRTVFAAVPDAPVTKFTLEMQGGRKGLLVNSTNICSGRHRANVAFTGQNGKRRVSKPRVKAKCRGKKHRRH